MIRSAQIFVKKFFCALGAGLLGLGALGALAAPGAGGPRVLEINFEGAVDPGSADFLISALRRAARQGDEALVVRLDTPGGLLESARQIVAAELASTVPVIVWIGPAGARAGSAGVFVTLAANLSAMAAGTEIGAAHPVGIGAVDASSESDSAEMFHKIENDTVAWVKAIAEQRGRDPAWFVSAVKESASIPEGEAVRLHVVDLQADTLAEVLRQADGRAVTVAGGRKVTLHTRGAAVVHGGWSIKDRLVHAFANPEIASILGALGILGILIEFYHPGAIYPGVLGAILLVMAGVGFQMLPIHAGAALLILLGMGFIVAELYFTGYGMLAVAGAASIAIGAAMLVNQGSGDFYTNAPVGIPLSFILPTAGLICAGAILLAYAITRAQAGRQRAGDRGLVGEIGEVLDPVGPQGGKVFVHGETWNAVAEQPIAPGTPIEVISVDGLKLHVRAHRGQENPRSPV